MRRMDELHTAHPFYGVRQLCADITYIPVKCGFFHLVAVMDWATRRVLSWRLSNTMDVGFCLAALGGRTPASVCLAGRASPGNGRHCRRRGRGRAAPPQSSRDTGACRTAIMRVYYISRGHSFTRAHLIPPSNRPKNGEHLTGSFRRESMNEKEECEKIR